MVDTFNPVTMAADGDATDPTGGNPFYPNWSHFFQGEQLRYDLILNPSTGFYEPQVVDGVGPVFESAHGAGFVFQPASGSSASGPVPGVGVAHDPSTSVIPAISDPIADVLNGPHGGAAPAVFDPAAGDAPKATILVKPAIPAHFTIGL